MYKDLTRDHDKRLKRLAALGISGQPDPEFNEVAANLGTSLGTAMAMVNFPQRDHQYFMGLYEAQSPAAGLAPHTSQVERKMPLNYGGCPHVLQRKGALPLPHILDYPHFIGNPVIDRFGIISYIGAPIMDAATGLAIGTVCAVDTQTHDWDDNHVTFVKDVAHDIAVRIGAQPR